MNRVQLVQSFRHPANGVEITPSQHRGRPEKPVIRPERTTLREIIALRPLEAARGDEDHRADNDERKAEQLPHSDDIA